MGKPKTFTFHCNGCGKKRQGVIEFWDGVLGQGIFICLVKSHPTVFTKVRGKYVPEP